MNGCAKVYPVYSDDGLVSLVRCGQCLYCRRRRRDQWIGRLRLEAKDHEHCRFVTLTYKNDPGVLQYEDMQLFLKRMRHYWENMRYFAVGEYGDKLGRGHWHIITFGPDLSLGRESLQFVWKEGFSLVGTATTQSMAYVAAYTLKRGRGVKRTISRMSLRPGIGFSRIDRMAAAAAPVGLPCWPTSYFTGGDRYPLCDGGIERFKRSYLEYGGVPPASLTPEQRDMVARLALGDRGTRIEERRRLRLQDVELGFDVHSVQHG